MTLSGPCKAAIEFNVQGLLKAPANPGSFGGGSWVNFLNIDHLRVYGGGTFDGQGETAWGQNNCFKDKNCKLLPIVSFSYLL